MKPDEVKKVENMSDVIRCGKSTGYSIMNENDRGAFLKSKFSKKIRRNDMKKRVFAALMCMTLAVSMISGCSSGKSNGGESAGSGETGGGEQSGNKLVFWTLQQSSKDIETAQNEAVEEFEKEYGCEVEITAFPYTELRDKLITALSGGKGPDIVMMDQIWTGQYASSGFVYDLGEFIEKEDGILKEDYFPGAWDSCSYLGKTYGLPFDVGVWGMLYYNKDMFKKAGLDPEKAPETWEELLDYGKKMTTDTQYGIATWIGTGDAVQCMVDAFTFSGGGALVSDDHTEVLLNSEEGIAALDFWNECSKISPPGVAGRGEDDSFKLFASGQCAMAYYGEWGQDTLASMAPDMDYGVALLPVPEGGTSIGTLGGFNLGINANSENKELAWDFIKYTTREDVNEKIVDLTPANKNAAAKFLNENRKYPDAITEQLEKALFRPTLPNYPEMAEIQRTATQSVILGESDSKTALDKAAEEVKGLLKK